eukprot:TRINITY_DN19940_c0_g1_i1.p1 TRINITY_DN19940_c0_g1~~TRINITY_DN19940_c0_g1_i1.p1  ORF type:complete len:292 (-),score=68.41 TRINITY_DN19940_c0_g1_i1:16-891(-)
MCPMDSDPKVEHHGDAATHGSREAVRDSEDVLVCTMGGQKFKVPFSESVHELKERIRDELGLLHNYWTEDSGLQVTLVRGHDTLLDGDILGRDFAGDYLTAVIQCPTLDSFLACKGLCNINSMGCGMMTALHFAAEEGNHIVAGELLQNAGFSFVNMKDGFGRTALHLAGRSGSKEIVDLLLSDDSGFTEFAARDDLGATALHKAVMSGSCEAVRAMMRNETIAGGVVVIKDDGGRSALDVAMAKAEVTTEARPADRDDARCILEELRLLQEKHVVCIMGGRRPMASNTKG